MNRNAASVSRKFFAKKWLVILIITVVLTVFGRVVDNKSLAQSAIVIGMGLDLKDGVFTVSAQVVNVTGTTAGSSTAENFITYTESAKTISEAVDSIGQKMGLTMSLSHCNVAVLSKSVASGDPIRLFNALSAALSMPEQAVLVAADDVKKVLTSRVATTVNMPFYTQSTLLENLGSDGMSRVTLKDFLSERLSRSGTVNLPFVEIEPLDTQPLSDAQSSSDNVILSMNKNLVVSPSGCFVLDKEPAKAANLFLSRRTKDKLSVETEEGGALEYRIIKQDLSVKVNGMKVEHELKFDVFFLEAQGSSKSLDSASKEVLDGADALSKKLEAELQSCFQISQENNADILRLQNEAYKKIGRKLPENCLKDLDFSIKVQLIVKGNG